MRGHTPPAAKEECEVKCFFIVVLSYKYSFFQIVSRPSVIRYVSNRDGRSPDLSGIPDFFLHFREIKEPEPGKLTIYFYRGINGGMIRHYCRPATHSDLIGISRFFRKNLEVSRFPDSPCENPRFLFCFELGKTKRRLTLSHVPCLQAHKAWAKNKFYDSLN